MKLLVTGGAGFIGANFIIYWLKNHPKDEIINLDKLTYAGNLDNLLSVTNCPNYHFIKGDITDSILINKIMTDIDTVVHFAAESHVDRSINNPSVFVKTNVLGTEVLLDSALKNKVKHFHHISTDEVFGSLELSDKGKFSERTNYEPRSPYAASKAASDHLVRSYYYTYGLPVTITNCSNNFGPYQHPEKLIPLAITNLLDNKKVPVYGRGLNIRDWLYVEDHCRAIDAVLDHGKTGETYCIGGMTNDISNIEIVKMIVKRLKKSENYLIFVEDRKGHDQKYSIDWSKINRTLGWSPKHDFEKWLEETIEWYKNNKQWWIKQKGKKWKEYYRKQYNTNF